MSSRFEPLTADDPDEVGGYALRARIGVGGMGRVYLAFTQGGRALALKVIRPEHAEDEEFRRRFRQEVDAAQRVQGLCTAPVVDSDSEAPIPWLATAYVPGPSLRQAVTEHGPLPLATVFRLMAGVAEGLAAVHACGLIHRDLTPANVLLADDGPRVIDFGIAHAAAATSLTRTGMKIGTPALMSPEQVRGRSATTATDVFALGQLAVFAATGHTAFGEGNQDALFYRILNEPPDLDDCPAEVRAIAERCLEKDPDKRPTLTEVMAYARKQTEGQTMRLAAGSWLPTDIATSLGNYGTALYDARTVAKPPKPRTAVLRTGRPLSALKKSVLNKSALKKSTVKAVAVGLVLLAGFLAFLMIGPDKVIDSVAGVFSTSTARTPTETAGEESPEPTSTTRTTAERVAAETTTTTTTTTTERFDPSSLNDKSTDVTPQTTSALLADEFTDSEGRTFTFEAGSHRESCIAPAQTDDVEGILNRNGCIGVTTGAFVSADGTILVSVKVLEFANSEIADNVYEALKDVRTEDLGIVCPKTGAGSEPCEANHESMNNGWKGQKHRYVIGAVATFTGANGSKEALTAAAEEGYDSAGPHNYSGNR
ncbi:serine/threonine-protein kinase [Saccharothrix sp. NRRL B-16314]|uniref:serine/threonine-protein kinase n=1 Tax=Saccharothrix sp. NRRL B-16314 TaxID=1463825 RepID=UPI00068FC2BD|nr:serine/threonine-protein kinase [Saccharothrix sp. NRRL B-16314]